MIKRLLAGLLRGLIPAAVLACLLVLQVPAAAAEPEETSLAGSAAENATSPVGWEVQDPPAGLGDAMFVGIWGNSSSDVFAATSSGAVIHYDGDKWDLLDAGPLGPEDAEWGGHVDDIWGTSSSDLYLVGERDWRGADVFHYDGVQWTTVAGIGGDTTGFNAVWGSSASDVFATGYSDDPSFVLHYDGDSWTFCQSPGNGYSAFDTRIRDIWGTSSSDVFAVGTRWQTNTCAIYHYDGTQWTKVWESSTFGLPCDSWSLNSVWSTSASDAFAVGWGCGNESGAAESAILHYDGSTASLMSSGTANGLSSIWGRSPTDVYAVGGNGTIVHYDGVSWSAMSSGTNSHLFAMWGSQSSGLFAVGKDGTILHYAGSAPPGSVTSPAADVTDTSAALNGTLTSRGSASSVRVSFEWGATTEYGNRTTCQEMNGPGAFKAAINGLVQGNTYHFRARADGVSTSYGQDATFSTPGEAPPAVVTVSSSAITANQAMLNGELTSVGEGNSIPSVVGLGAGGDHSMAVCSDGTLWAWGWNQYGQLGLGDIARRDRPARVGCATDWAAVAPGYFSSLGLRSDGTLWAWGWNANGQLGLGDTGDRWSPVQVGSDNDWVAVSTWESHTLGLRSDGTLWAWGSNYWGQLGIEGLGFTSTPTRVGTAADWVSVAAAGGHSLGVRSDGTLWAWGSNGVGQLGLGDDDGTRRATPVQVGTDTNWVMVSGSGDQSLGLRSDGTLWAWGRVCNGDSGAFSASPTQVRGAANWVTVSVKGHHCLGLRSDGTVWSWGRFEYGCLGLGDTLPRGIPTQVGSATDWVMVSQGAYHSLGLRSDGTVWSWGKNDGGQLGLGDTAERWSPTAVPKAIEPCQVSFEWGLTADYGSVTAPQTMTATGVFSPVISGLSPDTTYHYRAVAMGDGTAYGDDMTFTTAAEVPDPGSPEGPTTDSTGDAASTGPAAPATAPGESIPPGTPGSEFPSVELVVPDAEPGGDGAAANTSQETAAVAGGSAAGEPTARARLWLYPVTVVGGFLGLAAMGSFAAWLRGRIK